MGESSLRCLGLSAVWLCGEIQNSGPGCSLGESHGGKALKCSGPVETGSETRNDWQGTTRIDGFHRDKNSKDPGFGCKPPMAAVWQDLNMSGSTKATNELYHKSVGIGSPQEREDAK